MNGNTLDVLQKKFTVTRCSPKNPEVTSDSSSNDP